MTSVDQDQLEHPRHLISIYHVDFFVRNNLMNQTAISIDPVPKVIKLSMETSFKSQASDWLKWRLVGI
jgi:hypothetical protein